VATAVLARFVACSVGGAASLPARTRQALASSARADVRMRE
jgi:hypothetical protein